MHVTSRMMMAFGWFAFLRYCTCTLGVGFWRWLRPGSGLVVGPGGLSSGGLRRPTAAKPQMRAALVEAPFHKEVRPRKLILDCGKNMAGE